MAKLEQINLGVIGVGWVGGIRATACKKNPLIDKLHIAEINKARQNELKDELEPYAITDNWKDIVDDDDIDAVVISMTPETKRFPMVMECLEKGKHVFVEKPIAPTIKEADEALQLAKKNNLKLTIGYSRRFDPRYAYMNKALKGGLIGDPVTCLISRHSTRELGMKITGRSNLSPASIAGVHDIDYILWAMQPRKPIRVYSQTSGKLFSKNSDNPDHQWVMITMDDGTTITIGIGWILPPHTPNYVQAFIEVIGTEGTLTIDDSHKDIQLSTIKNGIQYPMSSMPGEQIDHVFAGSMHEEVNHFISAIVFDHPVMITGDEAKLVMQVSQAADMSVESGEPVSLPRNDFK
ncbi:Gfo/Idh/MocA family oxidoreductase [Hyphomicrobiales bacterium]|jgi:predicted dehydrogenase|nr:Gfo/Idh/MocA family oxidoreductase [Hyphomicrobiales bacterium]MDC3272194.1 Gfo/Idh/MocA family oxidoreductase [Hyphomicrobiales bacterium]